MNQIISTIFDWSIYGSFLLLIVSLVLTFIRFLRGPSIPDRLVAFDLIVIILMGIIILFSISINKTVFFDAVIIMALISFLGTVAYAKYLEKGVR
jgi:multicomponent Na+:H+ antiporter subunit F